MPRKTDVPADDLRCLQALAHDFSAGRHEAVVQGARQLLHRSPALAAAHKLLGVALLARGDHAEAVIALQAATRLDAADAQAFSNLGNALAAAGQFASAVSAHEAAIRLQPGSATFRYNLACSHLQQGDKAAALERFLQAYELSPLDRELAHLCRELLLEIGGIAQAREFCQLNVLHLADDAAAWSMLGALLLDMPDGDLSAAEAALREALRLAPDDAVAWSNLGVLLQKQTRLAAAIDAGERAVALAPEWAIAYSNLGSCRRDAGEWAAARDACLQALALDAECVQAYYNLACVSIDLGEPEMARGAFIEAVQRSPRPAWLVLAAHACRQVADWDGAELLESEFARQAAAGEVAASEDPVSPFAFLTLPGSGMAAQLETARRFAAQFAGRQVLPSRVAARRDGRLRIGLLSSDFRDHATAHLLIGVLEAIDASRFQLIAYDFGPPADDAYRQRLEKVISDWVSLGAMSDSEAAQRMHADAVDIAVDLKGWTQAYRSGILAFRPAPVQMQWLGFPGTMGAPWIDYLIADAVIVPPGAEAGYSEKLLRLPGCYQPNDPNRVIGRRPSRTELGLPETALVMAAMHQPYKITRETFALWMRLLAAVPESVLWLLEPCPMAKESLCAACLAAGIPLERLHWAPRLPVADHLARLASADLALDTFPVNAHTTASDALWAGVPQVARRGDTFVSRVSASIVGAAGFPELVADNDEDYESLIVALLTDRARLCALREQLAEQRLYCALFDARRFALNLETAWAMAWARHEAGLAPGHLSVPG